MIPEKLQPKEYAEELTRFTDDGDYDLVALAKSVWDSSETDWLQYLTDVSYLLQALVAPVREGIAQPEDLYPAILRMLESVEDSGEEKRLIPGHLPMVTNQGEGNGRDS